MTLNIPFSGYLCTNDTATIDKYGHWVRQPLLIMNAKGMDRLAPFIGKEREGDFLQVAELLEYVYRVIADANNLHSNVVQFFNIVTQLNQLLAAVTSPVSRSIKDECNIASLQEASK